MSYSLTLTSGERSAFDWVGNRYATGDEFASILRDCMGPDDEWSQEGDITFSIPEHKAWTLQELRDSEDSPYPCFDDELIEKLETFFYQIV